MQAHKNGDEKLTTLPYATLQRSKHRLDLVLAWAVPVEKMVVQPLH